MATLTVRIAAALLAAATGACAITAIVFDRILDRHLAQRDDAELVGKVRQLKFLLSDRPDPDDIRDKSRALSGVTVGHDGLGFVLSNLDGRPILSAGAPIDPAVKAAAGRARATPPDTDPSINDVQFIEHGRIHWRVLTAQAQLQGAQAVQIVIGRDVHAGFELRRLYRAVMFTGSLAAAFGTAFIGWFAVLRGIRPLAEMSRAAHRITANHLNERVPVPAAAAREIHELADAFNGMIDRLEDAFKRLSAFSADLAHDLRTPLANLLLQSQIGLATSRSAEEYQSLLANNLEELERLQRMIDAMLFLARADNAQVALNLEAVDIRALLDRMAEFFELAADERGIELAVHGHGMVRADAALMERAVGNLLGNAIRHARCGSQVRLCVTQDAQEVTLAVANEGEPIAPQDISHVFDRFWRADHARSASDSSSGLGLSIVRSIAQLHGGHATVECRPGTGVTTFRLSLPRRMQ